MCWITDDAVLQAVVRVARRQGSTIDGRQLQAGDVAGRIFLHRLHQGKSIGKHMHPVIGGRTGQYAVIVLRKTLRLHQGFPPAIGARIEVGCLLRLAVESLHDVLGAQRGQMNGAVSEVRDLFRMMVGPAGVFGFGLVSRVRSSCGIPPHQVTGHLLVPDRTAKSAVADVHDAVVPTILRHPDLEADYGVIRGVQDASHAAEGGQLPFERCGSLVEVVTGSDRLRCRNGGVGQRQRLERCALRGGKSSRSGQEREDEKNKET